MNTTTVMMKMMTSIAMVMMVLRGGFVVAGEEVGEKVISDALMARNIGLDLNVECRPRPVVQQLADISKNPDYHRNIEIFQCSGTHVEAPDRRNRMCIATNKTTIKVMDQDDKQMEVFNHTECSMKCVCTLNKVCEPQDEHIYAVVCPPTLSWDTDSCGCKPPPSLGTGNEVPLTPENPRNDSTKPTWPTYVRMEVFVGSLVGEFVAVVLALVIMYRCKKSGYAMVVKK